MNRWIAGFVLFVVCAAALPRGAASDTRTAFLDWTIPGDDVFIGKAYTYDIRYSRSPISASNFLSATKLNTALIPGMAGLHQRLTVVGLTAGVGYFFALRTMDTSGNWSKMSNIAYLPGTVAGVFSVFAPPQFSAPRPNPARSGTRFSVTLAHSEWLRVEAFDVAGRRVRTLAMGQYSAGNFDLHWDLHDDAGHSLDAGAYLVRSQIGDTVFLRRLMVVH